MSDEKVFPDDYYKVDTKDAYKTISSLPEQIREAYRLAEGYRSQKSFSKVVVAGMGGSGIAGDFLKMVMDADPDCKVLVETAKGYEAPKSVDEDTLLLAVSYSGNTEETLSTYKTAVRKGCQAILVSSGGKMQELARMNNHQHVKLPSDLQPRMAVAYLFLPLLRIMENSAVMRSHESELKELIESLRRQPVRENAIELSGKLHEHVPIIYADSTCYPVAYRWKTQMNENAKATAFAHFFSELNHNELIGFTNRVAPVHVVILTFEHYHRRVLKRIGLTKDLLQKKGVPVTEIAIKGSLLKALFSAVYLGDLTSYFLALRYEVDPTPVALVEQFKKDLGPFVI